jgi:transcriptional regulator with XRE-family HTH domain
MVKIYSDLKSVMDAANVSKTTHKKIAKELQDKNLSHFLSTARCKKKLTQKEIAVRLKWSQTKVSNVESAYNDDIKMGDFISYLNACELRVGIDIFDKNVKTVDLIKMEALKIQSHLDRLRSMAKGDKLMIEAIDDFHEEADQNLKRIVRKSRTLLGANKKAPNGDKSGEIVISTPSTNREESQV